MMDWEKYRRLDKSIDLERVYNEEFSWVWDLCKNAGSGETLLIRTNEIHPITSRQVATLAIATAVSIAQSGD